MDNPTIPSICLQVKGHVSDWVATTDRNFKTGDRVVHLSGGHNGRTPCPARGVLVEENEFWTGQFGFLMDGKPDGHYFYPEMSCLVKESDFDALNLLAI